MYLDFQIQTLKKVHKEISERRKFMTRAKEFAILKYRVVNLVCRSFIFFSCLFV
jgi:hypothetical protein